MAGLGSANAAGIAGQIAPSNFRNRPVAVSRQTPERSLARQSAILAVCVLSFGWISAIADLRSRALASSHASCALLIAVQSLLWSELTTSEHFDRSHVCQNPYLSGIGDRVSNVSVDGLTLERINSSAAGLSKHACACAYSGGRRIPPETSAPG